MRNTRVLWMEFVICEAFAVEIPSTYAGTIHTIGISTRVKYSIHLDGGTICCRHHVSQLCCRLFILISYIECLQLQILSSCEKNLHKEFNSLNRFVYLTWNNKSGADQITAVQFRLSFRRKYVCISYMNWVSKRVGFPLKYDVHSELDWPS